MNANQNYIPNKGDIVWLDFDPSSGKEIKKRRPGLVVSKYQFNRSTLFAVICPITNTVKNLPTRYSLPEKSKIQGQVLISQLKSLDFNSRNLEFADRLSNQDMGKINQIIEYIF
jgi:mRNA interferase MazF